MKRGRYICTTKCKYFKKNYILKEKIDKQLFPYKNKIQNA